MVSERDAYAELLFAIKEESAAGQLNPFICFEDERENEE